MFISIPPIDDFDTLVQRLAVERRAPSHRGEWPVQGRRNYFKLRNSWARAVTSAARWESA